MIKLKSLLKESLLNELDFGSQKAFDSYQKQHDMRGDTKVTVAGKKMSVSQAKDQSKDPDVKGSAVFGKGKGGEVFGNDKKVNTTPKSTEDIKAFYKKTRKLTDDNNHSEAAIELAKFMDDKESLKTLDKIKKDRDKRGYLTDKDSKIRSGITTNLLQKAKQQYKGKDYDKITGAF
jgi:hypothetical protein